MKLHYIKTRQRRRKVKVGVMGHGQLHLNVLMMRWYLSRPGKRWPPSLTTMKSTSASITWMPANQSKTKRKCNLYKSHATFEYTHTKNYSWTCGVKRIVVTHFKSFHTVLNFWWGGSRHWRRGRGSRCGGLFSGWGNWDILRFFIVRELVG